MRPGPRSRSDLLHKRETLIDSGLSLEMGGTDAMRLAQSLSLAWALAIVGALLLLMSGLSASGASAPLQPSPAGQEPALGAYAALGPVDVPDGMWYDATTGTLRGDALETDAELMAKSEGLDVDEAIRRLRAQQRNVGR